MKREITAFEQRVYTLVSRVPAGRVTTYLGVAKALDCGSSQAVGQALKRNPHAPEVPCHRVIRSDLNIGGYAGETGGKKLKTKLSLLKSEGVEFDGDGQLSTTKALFFFAQKLD